MRYINLLGFLILCLFTQGECSTASSSSVETFELTSKVFGNTRTIRILLPPEYRNEGTKNRYPVLYLNDGLMVFDSQGPGLRIKQVTFDLYKKKAIPGLIIVGIDNGACTDKTTNELVDRANEFLPYPDQGFSPGNTYPPEPPEPHGRLYPDFLVNEVMTEINKRYRTKTGPADTAIGGFSYGGVSALYTVIAKPGAFGALFLESTPLYIGNDYDLLRDAEDSKQWPEAVYIGAGTNETEEKAFNEEGEKNQKHLADIIRKQSPKTRIQLIREAGATHGTDAWRNRLAVALQFLFSGN